MFAQCPGLSDNLLQWKLELMNQCWLLIFLNQIWSHPVSTMGMETAAVIFFSSHCPCWPSSVSHWILLGQPSPSLEQLGVMVRDTQKGELKEQNHFGSLHQGIQKIFFFPPLPHTLAKITLTLLGQGTGLQHGDWLLHLRDFLKQLFHGPVFPVKCWPGFGGNQPVCYRTRL